MSKLQDTQTLFFVLQSAFDKIENYESTSLADPVIDALLTALLISPLESEDPNDAEM